MRLKDKVSIVTGASSDIGKEIAKRFAEEGSKVVLIARDFEKLEKARKEIGHDENGKTDYR
jgi:3-oxoacyl-[acyl-carrier protein] reductase